MIYCREVDTSEEEVPQNVQQPPIALLDSSNQPSAATSSGSSMKEQSGKVEDTVSTSGNKDSAAADPSTEIKQCVLLSAKRSSKKAKAKPKYKTYSDR